MSLSRPSDISTIATVPLWAACQNGFTDIANKLLENGADPNIASPNGEAPIIIAVKAGQEKIVTVLMKHPKLDPASLVYAFDASYQLESPAIKNHLASVAAGSAANGEGNTRLHIAVRKRDLSSVKALLDAGHSADVADQETKTPLGIAVAKNFYDIARLLVERNANPLHTEGLYSPIIQALWHEDDTFMQLLMPAIKKFANPEKPWFASAIKAIPGLEYKQLVIRRLIDIGVDKNYRDKKGRSIFDIVYSVVSIENDLVVGPMMMGKRPTECFQNKLKEINFLIGLGLTPSKSVDLIQELATDATKVPGQHEKLYREVLAQLSNNPAVTVHDQLRAKIDHKHHHKDHEHRHKHHKHKDKGNISEGGMFNQSEKKHHSKHSHKEGGSSKLKN